MRDPDAERASAARRPTTVPRRSRRLAALAVAIVVLLPVAGLADEAKRLAKARTWIEHAFPLADEFLRAYVETTLQLRTRETLRALGRGHGLGPEWRPGDEHWQRAAAVLDGVWQPAREALGDERYWIGATARRYSERLNETELDELLRLRDSAVGRRMGDLVAALAIYFAEAHAVLASGRDYEPGRLVPAVNLAAALARLELSAAEAKEIARFYERPIGKRVQAVDAEAQRHGLAAVLARIEHAEDAIAARLVAARPRLDAIAAEFAQAHRSAEDSLPPEQ
jgi:hypothetical protein